jgi:hypothetical protein
MESRMKHPTASFTQPNVATQALMAATRKTNAPRAAVFDPIDRNPLVQDKEKQRD